MIFGVFFQVALGAGLFDGSSEGFRGHEACLRVYVDKSHGRAVAEKAARAGGKSDGRGQANTTGANVEGGHREVEGDRTVGHGDGVGGGCALGEVSFEACYLGALRDAPGTQGASISASSI